MAKILLVEDDQDQNRMVSHFLTEENHVVDVAVTGADAKHLMQISEYDVIVLDRHLPDAEGVELCRWYRQNGSAPILMLTGKKSFDERAEGLDAGADDYLVKPFSTKELAARIRALLRRPTAVLPTVLSVGDYTLHPSTLTVEKKGVEHRLQPKEFALLEFLARHPKETFKGDALMARVWSADSEATTETLRTAIKKIRQKLQDEHIIEYVAAVGYRLGAAPSAD